MLASAEENAAAHSPSVLAKLGVAATKIGYIGLDGKGRVLEPEQKYPMTLAVGSREVTINRIAPVTEQLILSFIAEKVLDLPRSY